MFDAHDFARADTHGPTDFTGAPLGRAKECRRHGGQRFRKPSNLQRGVGRRQTAPRADEECRSLVWWPRAKNANDALQENFFGAFRAGLRYTRSSRPLHVVLLRAAIFFAFASAVWALLPLVARQLLGGDVSFHGILLGAVGADAIGGALVMPKLRERLSSDGLLLGAAVLTVIVMAVLSLAPPKIVAIVALLFLGGAWITALTTLNGAAQAVLPNWVRGRGLSVYLTVFNGVMTAGSLGWGAVGTAVGIQTSLFIGAAGLLVAGFIMHRIKLPAGDADMVPSNHWPEPLVAEPFCP